MTATKKPASSTKKPSRRKSPPKASIADRAAHAIVPAELRIEPPPKSGIKRTRTNVAKPPLTPDAPPPPLARVPSVGAELPRSKVPSGPSAATIGELANCLWYFKTRFFKLPWLSEKEPQDDPRARQALRRLDRAVRALGEAGITVLDPVGERYPPGGEGLMRPIEFLPMDGLTIEKVTETVRPIVMIGGNVIQRGEVFVAVPKEPPAGPTPELPNALPPDSELPAGADDPHPPARAIDGSGQTSQPPP